MKIFPPLIITENDLISNYFEDKLPNLKIAKLIFRDVKLLESYELKKCTQKYVAKSIPVKFSKVRSTVMYYGSSLTEITLENVKFHGFIEFCDVLLSAPNLEVINLHKVSLDCFICAKSYENIFKKVKSVKITETQENIFEFIKQFVDGKKINYTKSTVTSDNSRFSLILNHFFHNPNAN